MDIIFKNGVYVIDNRLTLLPNTFRTHLNEESVHLRTLNGTLIAKITEEDTIDGSKLPLTEIQNFFITHG